MGKEPTTGKLSAKERRRRYSSKKKTHPPSAVAGGGGGSSHHGDGPAGTGEPKAKKKARHGKLNPMAWRREASKMEAAGAAPETVAAAVEGAEQATKEECEAKRAMKGMMKRLARAAAQKQQQQQQPKQQSSSLSSSSALLASYPFATDYGDCFETPLQVKKPTSKIVLAATTTTDHLTDPFPHQSHTNKTGLPGLGAPPPRPRLPPAPHPHNPTKPAGKQSAAHHLRPLLLPGPRRPAPRLPGLRPLTGAEPPARFLPRRGGGVCSGP